MIRTLLLASSALALTATLSQAATCTGLGTDSIACTAATNDPVFSDIDHAVVTIDAGASVVSGTKDTATVEMTGDAASVINTGTIENQNTSNGGYAITGSGDPDGSKPGLLVQNHGTISSGDRGIEMVGGSGLRVENMVGASIEARRQAVRSGEENAYVLNEGDILSEDGRAVQVRGHGATVINRGLLEGGEEVVEARGGFTMENYGTIRLNDETIEDEDGVQFAGGTVYNEGIIRGTDDGIDMDEGLVRNTATGQIISVTVAGGNGIDIDEVYDAEVERQNGTARIENAGLIQGSQAVGTAEDASNSVQIVNSGTLRGTAGIAVGLDPMQGDSTLDILAGSVIEGSVLFGGGNDALTVAMGFTGSLSDSLFDGGAGTDTAGFDAFGLGDVVSFTLDADVWTLSLDNGSEAVTGLFRNFEFWTVGGTTYSTAAFASATSAVPLPAGMLLLGGALGALALRRRG